MSLSKKITLTISDYTCKISSPLCFYKGDALHLIFEINSYGITVNGDSTNRKAMPIEPLTALLLIVDRLQLIRQFF